ncbi:MAG: hypothetical protein RIQ53_1740 [Pseudomonadota bacterium]|jgi:hypothetical protein
MTESEKLALAAHLHVVMRRRIGRVTDVEWMVQDPAYARAMIDIAIGCGHEDVQERARKLQTALFPPRSRPLVEAQATEPVEPRRPVRQPLADLVNGARTYVGGLR